MIWIPGQPPSRFGFAGVVFDPATIMVGTTIAGGALKGAGSLASGSAASRAGQMQLQAKQFEAGQLDENAAQSIAAGQRQMLDTQQRTKMAMSTATARAGASGAAPDVGSPLEDVGQLAGRGSYQALMDMFNGQSKATGLENEAAGARYTGAVDLLEGQEKQKASYLAAGGDLLSSIGSAAGSYGRLNFPTFRGSAGANL